MATQPSRIGFNPRGQFIAAVVLLASVCAAGGLLDWAARNQRVAGWIDQREKEYNRQRGLSFLRDGYFIDDNDRLINEELPAADYSKGGVYFIGTSSVRSSTQLWDLPPAERRLIHNYGINQSDYVCQFIFLRYLVEHEGLFQAGGDKNLVVLAESYHNLARPYEPSGYFPNLWTRHGLYVCDPVRGIQSVAVNPVWRFIHFERTRIAGFVSQVGQVASIVIRTTLHHGRMTRKITDAQESNASWRARMGADWEAKLDHENEELGRMIDYLHQRSVRVVFVALPVASWDYQLPFEEAFLARTRALCAGRGIPMQDWSRMLPDEDMQDASHPNLAGAEKLQPRLLEIALPFVRSTGALPAGTN